MARALLLSCLIVPAVLFAGAAPQSTSGLLAGRIVDATTGAPLTNAVVSLSAAPVRDAGALPMAFTARRLMADHDGAFVFSRLPAGRYAIRAERLGYLEGAFGRKEPAGAESTIELGDAEIRTDITIALWKYAAIEGSVVDDLGAPVTEFFVYVLRRRFIAGHAQLTRSGTAATDDRGRFRVSSLEPGEYVVFAPSSLMTLPAEAASASASASAELARILIPTTAAGGYATIQQVGPNLIQVPNNGPSRPAPSPDGRVSVYQAMFYPGVSAPASAGVLALRPGEERTGIDMQLRIVPSVRVSGTLMKPDGPAATTSVRLVPAYASEFARDAAVPIETASGFSDTHGAFTLLGVPGGDYVIQATSTVTPSGLDLGFTPSSLDLSQMREVLWAAKAITVASSDVTNVAVSLRPGTHVSGRIEFDGASAPPTAVQLTRGWVWLLPAATGTLAGTLGIGRASIDASGRFTTAPVSDGKYVVRVEGVARWAMASAMYQGRDVADSPIEVSNGDVSDVAVRMIDRLTSLSGPVLDARGAPDVDSTVLVFPTDPALWVDGSAQPRRLLEARTDQHGTFAIDGAPQGEYFVVAVSAAAVGDWKDPRVLDRLSRVATRLSLAARERRTLTLTTVARPAIGGGHE